MNENLGDIRVISRDNPEYESYKANPPRRMGQTVNTPFYDDVVKAINGSETGDILLITIPHGIRYANLKKILYNRGFTGSDISINRQERDASGNLLPVALRPMRVFKKSDKKGRTLDDNK